VYSVFEYSVLVIASFCLSQPCNILLGKSLLEITNYVTNENMNSAHSLSCNKILGGEFGT